MVILVVVFVVFLLLIHFPFSQREPQGHIPPQTFIFAQGSYSFFGQEQRVFPPGVKEQPFGQIPIHKPVVRRGMCHDVEIFFSFEDKNINNIDKQNNTDFIFL